MEHLLGDAKRLIQRLTNHDNSVDILISEATNLQNKLVAMRQYKEEVCKLNDIADHRPRSTLILGSQLENQRIQSLEQENRELSISLAEHQSALELIMNKYREQVLIMMDHKPMNVDFTRSKEVKKEIVQMKEKMSEMAHIMLQSAAMDDKAQIKEIEFIRCLQVENENLRELLRISGEKLPLNFNYFLDSIGSCVDDKHNTLNTSLSMENNDFSNIPSSYDSVDELEGENKEHKEHVDNVDIEEELFDVFPMKKDSVWRKGQQLPLSFDDKDGNVLKIKNMDPINKLEYLFQKKAGIDITRSVESDDKLHSISNENYYVSMDPSESCFRAIISDIKPLDFNVDLNERLSEQLTDVSNRTNPHQSEKSANLFICSEGVSCRTSTTSKEFSQNDELSTLDFLDSVINSSDKIDYLSDCSEESENPATSYKVEHINIINTSTLAKDVLCLDQNPASSMERQPQVVNVIPDLKETSLLDNNLLSINIGDSCNSYESRYDSQLPTDFFFIDEGKHEDINQDNLNGMDYEKYLGGDGTEIKVSVHLSQSLQEIENVDESFDVDSIAPPFHLKQTVLEEEELDAIHFLDDLLDIENNIELSENKLCGNMIGITYIPKDVKKTVMLNKDFYDVWGSTEPYSEVKIEKNCSKNPTILCSTGQDISDSHNSKNYLACPNGQLSNSDNSIIMPSSVELPFQHFTESKDSRGDESDIESDSTYTEEDIDKTMSVFDSIFDCNEFEEDEN